MRIGIDIGGSHIGIGLVDENGNIIEKSEIDVNMLNAENLNIIEYIEETIEKMSKDRKVEIIGVGAPGNPIGKKITNLVNFCVEEIDFSMLEKKFIGVTVKVMNDAKVAALGEKNYGAMKGYRDGVYMCLGTGIGGAVFMNNELLIPKKNPGFEIGHMIIQKDGEMCSCGKSGCFEKYCSMKLFRNKVKGRLKEITSEPIEDTPEQFMQQLRNNKEDEVIKAEIESYIENLIVGISNLIDIFEPEVLCIGGSFAYYKDILFDEVVERINNRKYVFNKDSLPKIVLAELKNDAGIIGATLIP